VALVPVYLLETGVTLAVASVSAPVVFLSGLAAYLRSGQAKGSSEPLVPLPASPLSAPTLALLAALALVTVLRSLAPRRRTAAVFVASAAVLLTVGLLGTQAAQSLK
jgi:hypothetical protein